MTEGHTPDLIERVEEATGPDRELDADIALSIGYTRRRPKGLKHEYWFRPDGKRADPKPFTASIDAAMTLIEGELSGLELTADNTGRWQCIISTHLADSEGRGATPALALCAASLKARAIP